MQQPETQRRPRPAAWLFRPATLLALLAAQFALIQILTGIQYGDAPRNLHWGLLTFEQPGFLLGAHDTYERIKGFPPDPPSLGPREKWGGPYGSLHRWWGPVVPLLLAGIWGASRSYALLQLLTPLAAAGTVLLTYRLARDYGGERPALIAAAFLACFPLFRDYSTVSYTESISALAITAALLAHLRGRTLLTVALGALAALCKMDMLAVYAGVVGAGLLYSLLRRDRALPLAHQLAALAGPLLLAAPWVWLHYLGGGERGPTEPLSLALFGVIFPQMVEQTFFIPWYGALISFAAIGAAVAAALRGRAVPAMGAVTLLAWLGLGMLVLLVYSATPGAGNSPRIIIPCLPPLAILFGLGFPRLGAAWRRRIGFYLIALFALINLVTIGYHVVTYGNPLRAAQPAFAILRERERGFVLTPLYWETILYARQQATWFEADPFFEQNIMGDAANFARYVEAHPIRYALLPDADPTIAPEVRAYLAGRAEAIDVGEWTVYALP